MSDETKKTEYEAAFEQGERAAAKPFIIEGVPHIFVPADTELRALDDVMDAPKRIESCVSLTDVQSFLAYINRFHTPSTTLFFDKKNLRLVAFLDYHETGKPSWRAHSAVLSFVKSRAWTTWTGRDAGSMTQEKFAEFLEDNLNDILSPDGAEMLEIAMHLEATKKVKFLSDKRLATGAKQLTYEETIEGKGKGTLNIPSLFTLGIPLFEGSSAVSVSARLRYRISNDGQLTFSYHLNNPAEVLDAALDTEAEAISRALSTPVLRGSAP